MAYTQTQIDTLRKAIAAGATSVSYTDGGMSRRVDYRSLAEMQEILKLMENELADTTPSTRSVVAEFSRE